METYEKRKRERRSNDSREENKSLDHKIVEVQTDSGNEGEIDLLDSRH